MECRDSVQAIKALQAGGPVIALAPDCPLSWTTILEFLSFWTSWLKRARPLQFWTLAWDSENLRALLESPQKICGYTHPGCVGAGPGGLRSAIAEMTSCAKL